MRPRPRQSGPDLEHRLDHRRAAGLPSARTERGVLVLHLGAARPRAGSRQREALEDVQRLEAGDDDGDAVPGGDRPVFAGAHDGADVARGEEALHAVGGRPRIALHGRGHQTWETRTEKFVRPSRLACRTAMALAGAVVSKPDGEEHHLAVRVVPREPTASSGE